MANNAPRIMIAGTGSGCGKTMVTLAVLRAMQRRNIPLAAFKCGPDYIDPMFHTGLHGMLETLRLAWKCPGIAKRGGTEYRDRGRGAVDGG